MLIRKQIGNIQKARATEIGNLERTLDNMLDKSEEREFNGELLSEEDYDAVENVARAIDSAKAKNKSLLRRAKGRGGNRIDQYRQWLASISPELVINDPRRQLKECVPVQHQEAFSGFLRNLCDDLGVQNLRYVPHRRKVIDAAIDYMKEKVDAEDDPHGVMAHLGLGRGGQLSEDKMAEAINRVYETKRNAFPEKMIASILKEYPEATDQQKREIKVRAKSMFGDEQIAHKVLTHDLPRAKGRRGAGKMTDKFREALTKAGVNPAKQKVWVDRFKEKTKDLKDVAQLKKWRGRFFKLSAAAGATALGATGVGALAAAPFFLAVGAAALLDDARNREANEARLAIGYELVKRAVEAGDTSPIVFSPKASPNSRATSPLAPSPPPQLSADEEPAPRFQLAPMRLAGDPPEPRQRAPRPPRNSFDETPPSPVKQRRVVDEPPVQQPEPPPQPIQVAPGVRGAVAARNAGMPLEEALQHFHANGRGRKLKLLEMFKGTGSVGKQAHKLGMDVLSLDFDPIYTPDIETDILKWDYKKYHKDTGYVPDLIWASPPCNTFSPLAYPLKERNTKTAVPKSARAKEGTAILYRTIEIISYFSKLNPRLLYVMENPRGMMRNDAKVKKLPHRDTTLYCLYNDVRYKPTDFFNNVPPDGLHLRSTDEGKCRKTIGVVDLPLNKRYEIPAKLARTILQTMINHYTK